MDNKCEHNLKHNKDADYIFCTKCGKRWDNLELYKSNYPTYPSIQPVYPVTPSYPWYVTTCESICESINTSGTMELNNK